MIARNIRLSLAQPPARRVPGARYLPAWRAGDGRGSARPEIGGEIVGLVGAHHLLVLIDADDGRRVAVAGRARGATVQHGHDGGVHELQDGQHAGAEEESEDAANVTWKKKGKDELCG